VGIQRQYFLLGITSCGSPKEPPKQTVHIGGPIRHRNQPQWEPSLFLLTLAICDRIVVYAFGYNNKGQVGYDTSTASISVPTIVPGMSIFEKKGLSLEAMVSIAAGVMVILVNWVGKTGRNLKLWRSCFM